MNGFNEGMISILKQGTYCYKGNEYKIIKLVKMKSPVTNVWFDAVEYVAIKPKDDWMGSYVRSVADFLDKFTVVSEAD